MSVIDNGISDCTSGEDETFYSKQINKFNQAARIAIPAGTERCIYDRNNISQSVSHCLFYECPYHFKCSNTYCIHHKYVCDRIYDCPEGDDEADSMCDNVTCHHMFKCIYAGHCLHPDKICDGYKDCADDTLYGEDEAICDVECFGGCFCHGHTYACTYLNLTIKIS